MFLIPFSPSDGRSASARLLPMPSRLAASFDSVSPRRIDPLAVLALLSKRDRTVISLLAEHEVLTTAELATLCFPRLDTAERRLLRLTKLKVLDRFRWRLLRGSESWHYTLGPIGAALAAAARDVDPPTPATVRKRVLRLSQRPQLDHLVGLNEWFCRLATEAREIGAGREARLAEWWGERHCAEQYGAIVRPDAAATYIEDERRVDFFFEYDNGTETIGRVTAKLTRYGELGEAGGPKVPVLIWCDSAVRERHLADAIGARARAGFPSRITVATGCGEVTAALGIGLAAVVWWVPGEVTRRCLVDLASPNGDMTLDDTRNDDVEGIPSWET